MSLISFAGLASGFNSTDYIDAVMKQESVPLTKLQTKKSNTTAYQNVFNALNKKLLVLKDAAVALKDGAGFSASNATVSDPTKMSVTTEDGALSGDYTVSVTKLATKSVYQSASTKTMDLTGFAGQKIELKTGRDSVVEIKLRGSNTDEILTNLAMDINKESKGGIDASVIQTAPGEKKLVFTSKEAGSNHELKFITNENPSTTLTDADKAALAGDQPSLILSSSLQTALGLDSSDARVQKGEDATLTINGIAVTSSSNTVTNAIPGVTMQLTDIGKSTVKVTQDANKITDKVQAFVTAYNDIIDTIAQNTPKSTKNSDGTMSLTLQGDSMLRDLQSQLNNWTNQLFGSNESFKLMAQVGLEVDKGVTQASLMTGKITFDKEKFKDALAKDAKAVQNMFSSVENENVPGSFDGIGALFEKNLKVWTDSVDGLITSKVKGYSSDITFIDTQIENMKTRLSLKEESLKKQFTNLEVVMSSLNNQKSWITSQFAALTKSSS